MLAIIPARGGSKGLPGKNIKAFAGLPLIAHTIKAALASKYIDKVVVSTDAQEIYDIAQKYGAHPSFLRPEYLASDDARAIDAYTYTLDRLKSEYDIFADNVVILQPTSPLRTSSDIDEAIDLFLEKKADSVISYTEELHPVQWHRYISESLQLESIFPESLDNRQKFKKSYYPNGAVYVFKVSLLKMQMYTSEQTYAYVMPRTRSVDIDTIDDFNYAEYLMGNSNEA